MLPRTTIRARRALMSERSVAKPPSHERECWCIRGRNLPPGVRMRRLGSIWLMSLMAELRHSSQACHSPPRTPHPGGFTKCNMSIGHVPLDMMMNFHCALIAMSFRVWNHMAACESP